MNEKASKISTDYVAAFRMVFNNYVQVRNTQPQANPQPLKDILWRLGVLVEIWTCINVNQKEQYRG